MDPTGNLAPKPFRRLAKPPKVKVEFTDVSGAKYSINVEGPSKDNIAKLMDFIDSISVQQQSTPSQQQDIDTNFARVFRLIEMRFRLVPFSSLDILEAYQREFQLHSNLSTISTYLARLAERGWLIRSRSGSGWIYRLEQDHATQETDFNARTSFIPR